MQFLKPNCSLFYIIQWPKQKGTKRQNNGEQNTAQNTKDSATSVEEPH
jgi:hypothetical protein